MSKSEMFIYKLCLQLELKRLMLVNRVLNANIRAYSVVLKQLEEERMYA